MRIFRGILDRFKPFCGNNMDVDALIYSHLRYIYVSGGISGQKKNGIIRCLEVYLGFYRHLIGILDVWRTTIFYMQERYVLADYSKRGVQMLKSVYLADYSNRDMQMLKRYI